MKKQNNNEVMRQKAVAYIRISQEEQSSYSIQNQKEFVLKESKAQQLELPDNFIFTDNGFSATNLNRPAFIKLLECIRKNSNDLSALIVYKIDRISRDTADYLGFRKTLASYGIKIISCTEPTDSSPAGEFIETILAAAARYENMIKQERIKSGVLSRIKDGYPAGQAPLGYLNINKKIIEDPDSFELVQDAWLKMLHGTYTLQQIAEYLNENDVRIIWGKKKRLVTKQYLSKLFINKTYCGYAISPKNNLEIKSDKFKPMIGEEIYYQVRAKLMKRNECPSIYQKLRPEFPLRGFLLCDKCMQPLRAGFSKGRSRYYGYYFCQDHATPSIPSDDIDDSYIELLRKITPDPMTRKLFLDYVKEKWNEKYMNYVKNEQEIEKRKEDYQKMKLMIAEKVVKGVIDDETAKAMFDRLENEKLVEYNIPLHDVQFAKIDIETEVAWMNLFLKDLGKAFMLTKDLQLQRLFTGSIFEKKMIYRNKNLEPLGLSDSFAILEDIKAEFEAKRVNFCAGKRT